MSLPTPATEAGRAGLAALLRDPASGLIAFDFDGTLAPIVPAPDDARAFPGSIDALRTLAGIYARVAIVTGRPARWLVDVAGLGQVPGLVIAGQYGAERWSGGRLYEPEAPPGVAAVRQQLPRVLAGADARIEDKRMSLVVHTRLSADPDRTLAALSDAVRALADQHGLEAHPGRYVIEVRPPGLDKGGALRELVREYDVRAVLFAGDDVGDIPAFAAVEELRSQGVAGLTVCSASAEVPQLTERADLVVDGPPGVTELLTALAEAAKAH